MADHQILVDLFLKKEGGLSRDPDDSASANPAPCRITYRGVTATNWHTNKGVTWATFRSQAQRLGYNPTCANFALMPPWIWGKIFKQAYWDAWGLDQIESQAMASVIVWWSWGSGNGGAFSLLEKYLKQKGITVTSRVDAAKELDALAARKGNRTIFMELRAHRLVFYRTRRSADKHYAGWKKAYDAFTKWADDSGFLSGSGPGKMKFAFVFLALATTGVVAFKSFKSKNR